MLQRPKAKKFTQEQIQAITLASEQQTGKPSASKSYDMNFPAFEVPVNQKLLVYVPNHTVMRPDGSMVIAHDRYMAHPVIDGRSHTNIRCSSGVVIPELGLDGSCPLCDCSGDVWKLYNLEYEAEAKVKGIPTDSELAKEGLRDVRQKLVREKVISEGQGWYVFPIVVIKCKEENGKLTTTPELTPDGQLTGTPYFYQIREKTFKSKWIPAFDSIDVSSEDCLGDVGGRWYILNFTYDAPSGTHTKMNSANALKVSIKTMGDKNMPAEKYAEWATYFDQMTQDWTVEKSREVLVYSAIRDMEEMQVVADTLMKPVRDKIALHELGGNGKASATPVVAGDAQAVLESFGSTPVVNNGEVPPEALNNQNVGIE